MPFVLDQIHGWQTARKKLPTWAANDNIVYPPHINMEQCSSEKTALYKAECLSRIITNTGGAQISKTAEGGTRLIDLTGGLGVDFAFMARRCTHAVHVERNGQLSAIAGHNFKTLGLCNVGTVCGDGVEYLHSLPSLNNDNTQGGRHPFTIIYIDPARRGDHGQRVYGIADCTPDVLAMKEELLQKADCVMLKLSPMLDWHAAVKAFGRCCREVHIVSVANECKELLLLLRSSLTNDEMAQTERVSHNIRIECVNDDQRFEATVDMCNNAKAVRLLAEETESIGRYLYVPNASAMKSGLFAHFTEVFPVSMLSHDAHLFVSDEIVGVFPGRRFVIDATTTMNKQELRQKLKDIDHANVAVRNFPLTADALKKRLRLQDGGDTFIFGTTLHGKHILFITHPA